jgi:hypothetical protein
MAKQVVYIDTPYPTLDQIAASIGLSTEERARLDEEVRTRKRIPHPEKTLGGRKKPTRASR